MIVRIRSPQGWQEVEVRTRDVRSLIRAVRRVAKRHAVPCQMVGC